MLADTWEKHYFGHHHEQTKATPKCYGLVIMHINENHAHVGMVHGYIDDPSSLESATVDKLNSRECAAIRAIQCIQLIHDPKN